MAIGLVIVANSVLFAGMNNVFAQSNQKVEQKPHPKSHEIQMGVETKR